MRFELTLTALVVASAFAVGFSPAAVGDAQPRIEDARPHAGDADLRPAASVGTDRPAERRVAQQDPITGQNVTVQNVTLSNVTLVNVVVSRLVVDDVSVGATERTVTFRNVSGASVRVGNASVRNLTFDTMGINRSLSTALLGNVGTGIRPNDSLPRRPLQAKHLEDRIITGVEIGTLHVDGGAVVNTTIRDRPEVESSTEAPAPDLTGQGVTAEQMTVRNATVVGWSVDTASQNATRTEP